MIGKLLFCLALGVSVSLASWAHTAPQAQAPQPQPVKQDITIYYASGNEAEMAALGCMQSGSGYLCRLVGAGGGHAFKD